MPSPCGHADQGWGGNIVLRSIIKKGCGMDRMLSDVCQVVIIRVTILEVVANQFFALFNIG